MANFFVLSKGVRQNFRGKAVLFLTPKDGQENKAESGQVGAGGRNTGGRNSPKEKSCLLSHSALHFRTKLLLPSIRSGPAQTETHTQGSRLLRDRPTPGRVGQLSQQGPRRSLPGLNPRTSQLTSVNNSCIRAFEM